MDINAFNAAATYGASKKLLRPETAPQGLQSGAGGFNPKEIVGEIGAAIGRSESTASAYMLGQADPHSVVEALATAELAVETAVTLRNRVVEAYQELMRMPV